MPDFATFDDTPGLQDPILVWSLTGSGHRVESRHNSLWEVAHVADVYRFSVPTTLNVRHPANEGEYPTVDIHGAPLWSGARVDYVVPTHHTETAHGTGVFGRVDKFGWAYFLADEALPKYGVSGKIEEVVREYRSPSWTLHRDGPLEGYRVLSRQSGDPITNRQVLAFVRLLGDPREVSTLLTRSDFLKAAAD
jgi:hypothetical protein